MNTSLYLKLFIALLCIIASACGPEPTASEEVPVIIVLDMEQPVRDMPSTLPDQDRDQDLSIPVDSQDDDASREDLNVMTCGNGVLDDNELCDGDCPEDETVCDDSDQCTQDSLEGSAASCDAACHNTPITTCESGDGCCAPGCTAEQDTDCIKGPGESCRTNEDCGESGQCARATGGYCVTETGCRPGATCGEGEGICLSLGNNLTGCVPSCEVDADCRTNEGYSCAPIGSTGDRYCAPGVVQGNGMAGAPCTRDSDCGDDPTETCLSEALAPSFSGGYCVTGRGCQPGSCGGDNVCVTTSTSATACYDGCTTDADCRTDYECLQTSGQRPVCYPKLRRDEGKPGEACTSDADCTELEFCAQEDGLYTGGYCTRYCTVQEHCPSNSDCHALPDTPGLGLCMQSCRSDQNCRAGYACLDRYNQNLTGCFPVASGPQHIGDTCAKQADCQGALALCNNDPSSLYPGGYCSAECQTDADCDATSHCSDYGSCVRGCTSNEDCREPDYVCANFDSDQVSECVPGGRSTTAQVGDACQSIGECSGGERARCLGPEDTFEDGYCVQTCDRNTPCPTGSHCGYRDNLGSGVCLKDCQDDQACRADGYQCFNADNDTAGVMECAPSGTGPGGAGAACSSPSDCQGGPGTRCSNTSPNGYCVMFCQDDSECGAREHCAFKDPSGQGLCAPDCSADSDCRTDEDYHCLNADNDPAGITECYISGRGTGEVGDACADLTECRGGTSAACLRGPANWPLPGNYCSLGCADDMDCGDGNHCLSGICYKGCNTLYDCRNEDGHMCIVFASRPDVGICYTQQP